MCSNAINHMGSPNVLNSVEAVRDSAASPQRHSISISIAGVFPYITPFDSLIPVHQEPWISYQIRNIACCVCAGNAGNVFPADDLKGNRYLIITACITAHTLPLSDNWLPLTKNSDIENVSISWHHGGNVLDVIVNDIASNSVPRDMSISMTGAAQSAFPLAVSWRSRSNKCLQIQH